MSTCTRSPTFASPLYGTSASVFTGCTPAFSKCPRSALVTRRFETFSTSATDFYRRNLVDVEFSSDKEVAVAPEVDRIWHHSAEEMTMDADLLNNLAIAEAHAGDIDAAVKHLQEALSLEPGPSPFL